MLLLREFEARITELSRQGHVRGSLHLSEGQEAIPAGACAALRPDDTISGTYRNHGYLLARGSDLNAVMAEVCGRADGLSRGRGGKLHLIDLSVGVLGTNGIVAAGAPIALGAALAAQMDGRPSLAVAVFGDGAMNQGVFHESATLAALWKLPVLFLCENNQYSEMTPVAATNPVATLVGRMAGYGMPARSVDGNDPAAVREAVREAGDLARSGGGPSFLEAVTYRTCGHYQGDSGSYRSKEEVRQWERRSPIARAEAELQDLGVGAAERERVLAQVRARLDAAVAFALASPFPDPQELFEDVYA